MFRVADLSFVRSQLGEGFRFTFRPHPGQVLNMYLHNRKEVIDQLIHPRLGFGRKFCLDEFSTESLA